MPAQRLGQRHVEVAEQRPPPVAVPQRGQHVAVAAGVQDALQDHVVAVVEREPDGLLDQGGRHTAGLVPFAQDDAAQVVLLDEGAAPAVPASELAGDAALARTGVAPDADEDRVRAAGGLSGHGASLASRAADG